MLRSQGVSDQNAGASDPSHFLAHQAPAWPCSSACAFVLAIQSYSSIVRMDLYATSNGLVPTRLKNSRNLMPHPDHRLPSVNRSLRE